MITRDLFRSLQFCDYMKWVKTSYYDFVCLKCLFSDYFSEWTDVRQQGWLSILLWLCFPALWECLWKWFLKLRNSICCSSALVSVWHDSMLSNIINFCSMCELMSKVTFLIISGKWLRAVCKIPMKGTKYCEYYVVISKYWCLPRS